MRVEAPLEQAVDSANRRGAMELAQARRLKRLEALAPHESWALARPTRERAVLLDDGGRVITRKEGEFDAVMWTEAALRPLVGRVDLIIHNHPRSTSLGENDVDLATYLNAREVSALTATRRYRLHRLGNTWPPDREFAAAIADERDRLVREIVAARDEGRIDDAGIERTFYHVLWGRVAARYQDHLSYDVERRA